MHPNRQSRSICFRNSARTLAGSLSKVAESSGPAPQALRLETASNRSPRFAVLLSQVSAAGFAPASVRLEGGGLNCSATRSGPRGGSPTRNTAFEAPHDCNFTTRGKWSPCQDGAQRRWGRRRRRPEGPSSASQLHRPQREKWSLHEDLHLDFKLRGLVSWLLDDGEKNGAPRLRSFRATARLGTPADVSLERQSVSGTDSTSWTSASGSRSSFCIISNTRSLQPARQ